MARGKGSAGKVPYVLPRHPGEADRLDLQHHVLRAVLKSNYLAPIERPARLLDVGSGTGQWAAELATEFPDALVVGMDLVPGRQNSSPSYRFVRANVLHGLPFGDGCFDFVHQRLLVSGIPVSQWPAAVADLVRVTRPGGWVELVEAMPGMEPEGPATARLLGLLRQLSRTTGLDSLGHVMGSLERYLEQAGAVVVRSESLPLPIGQWGGSVGSWLASDARALFARLEGTFVARLGLTSAECHELIGTMLDEFEQHHPRTTFKIAVGQRPVVAGTG